MPTDYIGVGARNLLLFYRVQNAEDVFKLLDHLHRLITTD